MKRALKLQSPLAPPQMPHSKNSPTTIGRSKVHISAGDRKFLAFVEKLRREGRISSKIRVAYVTRSIRSKREFKLDDLLTSMEAGTFLSLSTKTLANWRTKGIGPRFSKLGSAVRYRYADLVAFSVSRSGNSTANTQASQSENGSRHG